MERNPSRVLVTCVALLAAGCGVTQTFDAGAPNDATTGNDVVNCPFCTDATYDIAVPGPPDPVPPPDEACDDAGACALPRSVCASAGWLEYFDDGTCVDGGCTFDVKMMACAYGCWDGGCVPRPSTTNPAP